MKRLFVLILFLTILFGFYYEKSFAENKTAQTKEIKIAVIDIGKVVNESLYGKDAMEKLQKKYEELSQKLNKKFEEVKKLKEEIETKSKLWSEEIKKKKEELYKKKLEELRKLQEEVQYQMDELQKKLFEPVFNSLEKIINNYMKEHQYDLLLEKKQNGIYYVSPRIDITSKIIEKFDEYYLKLKEKQTSE